jgi:hypothetical protein
MLQSASPLSPLNTRYACATETASGECSRKLAAIEDFAQEHEPSKEKTTRFTEEEINACLSPDAESQYKSCIKNFRVSLQENSVEGVASVDFNCLKQTSVEFLHEPISGLFSGTHVLTARGTIISADGEGSFELEEIRFDGVPLPGFLVEQAITAVCMRQDPPFDPLKSSALPYGIRKVIIHRGYLLVFQ